jgi:Immunoglobulin I-set domain
VNNVLKLNVVLNDVLVKRIPPKFANELADREITEGEDCQFEIEVAGKPTPTVTW